MDVLDTRIVHAACPTRIRVERAFEDCTEDSGRNLAPVEVVARRAYQQVFQFVGELRNGFVLHGEEPAVDIGEHTQVVVQVRVTLGNGRIQHLEEREQRLPYLARRVAVDIVAEELLAPEDTRILRIEAEHEPHAEHVEAVQRGRRLGGNVESQQFVVYLAYQFARFHRYLHLTAQVYILFLHHELQAVVFLVQVLEQHHLRLAVGLLHVVDTPRAEVAGYYPARSLAPRQFRRIAFGLLKSGQI